MTQSKSNWCWKLALAIALSIGGAIASSRDYAKAQITPDTTLGRESSQITSPSPRAVQIDGGATRGTNLFHSFSLFSVPTGGSAHFNNAPNIQNIFSRVTGASISNIDGLIKANGTANLFLINPNGIIFGPNATLNIGGSFLATTANSIKFADGSFFSATPDTQTSPLLTISAPIGLQYGTTIGSIVNQSTATDSNGLPIGLQVQPGNTLALVGGEVKLDGGVLQDPGGRVELGAVAGTGTVGLNVDNSSLRLSFPDGVARADVSLTNRADNSAEVNVRAGGGGSIAITAQNFKLAGGSKLRAGIASGLGSVDAKAGNIEVNASGVITLTDTGSFISNKVLDNATGKGGDIYITAGSLKVIGGAQIFAGTSGHGDGGSVYINVHNTTSFDGEGTDTISSGAYSVVDGGVGNGGNVNLTSGSLSVTNGAALQANTNGQGNAGSVTINVQGHAFFDGQGADLFSSGAYSNVESDGVGNGGSVNVAIGSLSLTNGAVLSTSIRGQGTAGNVNIFARDTVSFDGQGDLSTGGKQSSGAFSAVIETGKGHGGNINVTTGSLFLTNGAALLTNTLGQGNAGNVNIIARDRVSFNGVGADLFRSGAYSQVYGVGDGGSINVTTKSLSVTNGAVLSASTYGQGNAGNVNINVQQDSSFDGVGINGLPSAAFSTVQPSAVGKGGDINVTTGSLSLTNGAELEANTFGQGDAGSVRITARDAVFLDGVANQGFSSGLFSGTEPTASGQGGEIRVQTGALHVSNGAVLSARTLNDKSGANIIVDTDTLEVNSGGQLLTTAFSSGKAGNITVNATNGVTISGSDPTFDARLRQIGRPTVDPASAISGLFANTDSNSTGQGGTISVSTGQLLVRDRGQVSASSRGSGVAGNLDITASSIRLDNKASLSSDTTAGQGDINLYSRNLILRHGSDITTNATGTATGGNITINTDNLVAIPKEDSDISANAQDSFGGRVIITAKGIFGIQFSPQDTPLSDITATSALGPQFNGTVQLNTIGIDPSHGLTNLPIRPAEPKVAQVCRVGASENQSQFVVTGRGGLPPNPQEALSRDAVHLDWVTLNPTGETHHSRAQEQTSTMRPPLVEAQGWVINNKGQVVLVAQAPTVTPHGSWYKPSGCGTPKTVLEH